MLISNCCGSPGGKNIYPGKDNGGERLHEWDFTFEDAGICQSCGEHCEYLSEEDYEEARTIEILKPNI